MNSKLSKSAAVIAFIIGAMAIFAGGQVLLGKEMDYYVIDWLPIYNFVVGLVSAFLLAPIIWKNTRLALPLSLATFIGHGTVMLILQTVYRDVVAPDSVRAMTVRLGVWVIILALMIVQTTPRRAPA